MIIFNLDDAMHHPKYDEFTSKLLMNVKGTQFYKGNDKYNFYCFMRWVAMASVGGGWMSDYDTFPLNLNASFALPNNGTMTSFTGHVPNLVSGSADEWNRVVTVMIQDYEKNAYTYLRKGKMFWSDMLAFRSLLWDGSVIGLKETITVQDVYHVWRRDQEEITKPYDKIRGQCHELRKRKAIHFAHHGCSVVKFCDNRRGNAAKKWHQAWLKLCSPDIKS